MFSPIPSDHSQMNSKLDIYVCTFPQLGLKSPGGLETILKAMNTASD